MAVNSKKMIPKEIVFRKIKTGVTRKGTEFAFCSYKGRGVLIEKEMLEVLGEDFNAKRYKIFSNKIRLKKTSKSSVLKIYLNVEPRLWYQLEGIRSALKEGITWTILKKQLEKTDLDLTEVEGNSYGRFLSIRPSGLYLVNDTHKINIYPGNSLKNTGMNGLSLMEYIDKNDESLIFKSFKKDDSRVYYRMYLRKYKNRFKSFDLK